MAGAVGEKEALVYLAGYNLIKDVSGQSRFRVALCDCIAGGRQRVVNNCAPRQY